MRRITAFSLLFLFWLAYGYAERVQQPDKPQAQDDRPASDAHSFQELFQKLERNWIKAVQDKDNTSLDALLAPEFMYWTSQEPERPTPRADWVRHALTNGERGIFTPGVMAIRAFVGSALVSFQLTRSDVVGGKRHTQRYFVIDLWEVNHGKWQVADRYITPAGKPPCSAH